MSQPVGEIKVRRGLETYGGKGESLVKGVVVNLSAIALSVKPGGSIERVQILGGLLTHGPGVEALEPSRGGQESCGGGTCNSALGRMTGLGHQRRANAAAGMSARPPEAAVSAPHSICTRAVIWGVWNDQMPSVSSTAARSRTARTLLFARDRPWADQKSDVFASGMGYSDSPRIFW